MTQDDSFAIAECRIYRYRLRCARPLRLKGSILNERQGLIVQLLDTQGHQGLGETAPLPGFSRENLEQSLVQLTHCCRALTGVALDHSRWQEEYARLYQRLRNENKLLGTIFSSVRTGLEFAICELVSQRLSLPIEQLLNPAASTTLSLCPLLNGDRAQVLSKAHQLKDSTRITQVKLKVGEQTPQDDARLLRELCNILGDHIRFRLDANRQWSFKDAMRFAIEAPHERIIYIEEPTAQLETSRRFSAATGLGLALDETLQDPTFILEYFRELAALVVKPTLCGGLEQTYKWAHQARNWNVPVIISSSFESSLGVGQLAALAAALTPNQVAGLDTLTAFTHDLVRTAQPLLSTTPREIIPLKRLPLVWNYL